MITGRKAKVLQTYEKRMIFSTKSAYLCYVDLKDLLRAVTDLILPRTCVVCSRRLGIRERQFCDDCLSDIPLTYFWTLDRNEMADRFNALIQRDMEEEEGFARFQAYSNAAALFYYRTGSDYRNITRALKYHGNIEAGKMMAQRLGAKLALSPMFADVDLVVPVPLHRARKWKRGYNQAEIIGREIALALGAVCDADLLTRFRRTRTQTRVSVKDKGRNVAGAFRMKHTPGQKPHHILIVDDVFTTGATVNECRKTLRKALGKEVRISVATLGFTGQ